MENEINSLNSIIAQNYFLLQRSLIAGRVERSCVMAAGRSSNRIFGIRRNSLRCFYAVENEETRKKFPNKREKKWRQGML